MKCPNCGQEILNNSSFCEYCGAETPKRKQKVFLKGTLLIICLAVVGGLLWWKFGDNGNNETYEKEKVKETINTFNMAIESNDFYELSNVYADNVERYHDAYHLTNDEVIEKSKRYDGTFGVVAKHTSVRWNTLIVDRVSDDAISVVYTEDYSIDRMDKSKKSKFVLEKHLLLDNDYKIKSIYDVTLKQ